MSSDYWAKMVDTMMNFGAIAGIGLATASAAGAGWSSLDSASSNT
ncbi:hypothetical protein [Rhodococcus tukisamuensis]|uniref:Uncharacterized protein n=1 Tax=Rhodococcus tukisamuensis TaxID=168276 RepID=A0A1G6T7Z4_9NOCA|nr:hypothetical protein [Rhodococcus tukisamuensis]SDD25123.1 hypothetical protein SAMN05444580_103429 [Rhodococcus tukisamuensis]